MWWDLVGAVGTFVSVLLSLTKLLPRKRLTWWEAERAAKRIAGKITGDNFNPTLIVGIGRGGAIFGAMISGCLGHRPLLVIDRKYQWNRLGRKEDILFRVKIPRDYLERVLLVAGEVHSGRTMEVYIKFLEEIGAQEIRTATFYLQQNCPLKVNYAGVQMDKSEIKLPWMFSENYLRADRVPPDGK